MKRYKKFMEFNLEGWTKSQNTKEDKLLSYKNLLIMPNSHFKFYWSTVIKTQLLFY